MIRFNDISNCVYLVATAVFDTNMIVNILAIVTSCVILGFNIWRWVKEAKKDGKITAEEIEEGKKIIVDGIEDIADKVNKK